ncbi:hypothetical protein Tco_0565911 [Tanacetum coccineum]
MAQNQFLSCIRILLDLGHGNCNVLPTLVLNLLSCLLGGHECSALVSHLVLWCLRKFWVVVVGFVEFLEVLCMRANFSAVFYPSELVQDHLSSSEADSAGGVIVWLFCLSVTLKRLSLNSVSKVDDLQARNASSFTFSLLLQTLKVYIEEEDTIGVCGVDCGILPHLWLLQDPTIKAKNLLELP